MGYDDLGWMTSVTDGNGTIAYAYDAANRLLALSYPGGKSLGYGYDLVGNRTRLTYSDETYVEYTYDDLNRMDQVKDQEENVLADYSYDALRRIGLEYINGTSVFYEYNDAGWVTALYNTQSDPGDISYFVYTHDEVGNRLTNTAPLPGGPRPTHTTTPTRLPRWMPDGYPFPDMTYNYDPVGNRDSTVNGGTVHRTLTEEQNIGSSELREINYRKPGRLSPKNAWRFCSASEEPVVDLQRVIARSAKVGQADREIGVPGRRSQGAFPGQGRSWRLRRRSGLPGSRTRACSQ